MRPEDRKYATYKLRMRGMSCHILRCRYAPRYLSSAHGCFTITLGAKVRLKLSPFGFEIERLVSKLHSALYRFRRPYQTP